MVGQVCVDKAYRGQGIFRKLYTTYKDELSKTYDCVLASVVRKNERSMQAHSAIGFDRVKEEAYWNILCWDWSLK